MKAKNAISQISLPAPAKINLFLSVNGKRTDGFHAINSVLAKIDLCDLVTLKKTEKLDEIECACLGHHELSGSKNLAHRAIEEWRNTTGDRTGMKVTIRKRIPVMSGLGGGSSDAVATLVGLNLFHGKPLNKNELAEIALKLGSDCPFFLSEGLANVSGRGESLRDISGAKKKELDGQRIFLFRPPMGFSTPLIYDELSKRKLFSDSKWAKQNVENWESGLLDTAQFFHNDFESFILKKFLFLSPLFEELKKRFELSFQVSGSGSCCFSFVHEGVCEVDVKECIINLIGSNCRFWTSRVRLNGHKGFCFQSFE